MEGGHLFIFLLPLFYLATGAQSINCQNGGFPNGTTSCNCPPFWEGDNCSQIICLNGGSMTTANTSSVQRCVCPTGYIGVHCEAVGTITPPLNFFPKKQAIESSFNLVFINALSNYWGGLAYTQFQLALNKQFGNSNYSRYNLLTNNNSLSLSLPPGASQDYAFSVRNFSKDSLPPLMTPVDYSCYPIPYLKEILSQLINGLKLRETAITIFTQHPPAEDDDSLSQILKLAVSFDIRINAIWSDDSTFIRCLESDKDILRGLAEQTGGLFVTLKNEGDYTTDQTIMDTVLATHYQYEPLTMTVSSENNTSVTFYMNPPPTKSYYVVLSGATDSTSVSASNCLAFKNNTPMTSADGISSYVITGYLGYICSLSVTNAERVQVFGTNFVNAGPLSASFSKSYVEHPSIDTSRVQPDEGNPLYFALHAEGNGAFANPTLLSATFYQGNSSNGSSLGMGPRNTNDGLLEYVSNATIICNTSLTPAWIELSLQGSGGVAEKRYIPVFCQPQPSGASPAGYSYFEEADDDSDGTTTAPTVDPSLTPKSLILAYSALVPQGIHRDFILAAIPNGGPYSPYNSSFGEILFDTEQSVDGTWGYQDNYADFNTAVQTELYWGKYPALKPDNFDRSQILQALMTIRDQIQNNTFTQNSIVAVNVGLLPSSDDLDANLNNFYPFVMNNVKVVFFIGTSRLKVSTPYPVDMTILKQIATITSGHVVVYDDTEPGVITGLVTSALGSGPGQNLLLSKNFAAGLTPSTTLGDIDLTQVKGAVPIYVTMTDDLTNNTVPLISVLPFNVYFIDSKGNEEGSTPMVRQGISNYYTSSVNLILSGNMTYTAWTRSILSNNAKAIRIWTSYNITSPDVQVAYNDLMDEPTLTPDTNQGASLAAILEGDSTYSSLTMKLSDCTGNQIKLYDNDQRNVAPDDNGTTHFVPFFCTVQKGMGCPPETENLYYAQLTSDNGYISTKSFICAESQKSPKSNCNHTDTNGNYICGGSQSPYTRGPSGQLIDCSGSPLLKYNSSMTGSKTYAPFSCNCPGQGPSCEAAKCEHPNTEGGAVDVLFRTYTVIIAMDDTPVDKLAPGKLLAPSTPNPYPSNIWLYQLIVYCNSGLETILYIGTNYSNFAASFNSVGGICDKNYSPFDLNQIFETSLKALGRQQRGLIVFYTEVPGGLSYGIKVDQERFIRTAQQYRQELYIFNMYDTFNKGSPVNISSGLLEAVMSTGGTFIPFDYEVYDDNKNTMPNFFTRILTVPTSFNGHSIGTNMTINVSVEGSKTAYFIVGSQSSIVTPDPKKTCCKSICGTPDNDSSAQISGYGGMCACNSSITANFDEDIWYTVVVLESDPYASVPRAIIIQSRTDDQQTSVAVNYTTGGPTVAIYSGFTNSTAILNEDQDARSAIRQCTYDRSTVNAFIPLDAGYNNIKVDILGSPNVTKVFPFGVSSSVDCKNGKPNDGFGQCANAADWEGPDKSRPICKNGGQLSTWGTACNCQGTGYGGQFCQIKLTPDTFTTSVPVETSSPLETSPPAETSSSVETSTNPSSSSSIGDDYQ